MSERKKTEPTPPIETYLIYHHAMPPLDYATIRTLIIQCTIAGLLMHRIIKHIITITWLVLLVGIILAGAWYTSYT